MPQQDADALRRDAGVQVSCSHPSLRFGSGGYFIFCNVCNAPWVAIKDSSGIMPDHSRSGDNATGHRVKPAESSATMPKIVVSQTVKPNDSTRILRPDP